MNQHPCVGLLLPLRTRLIYTETLSNPTLVVADIPSLAAIARTKVRGSAFCSLPCTSRCAVRRGVAVEAPAPCAP